jgi:integrase
MAIYPGAGRKAGTWVVDFYDAAGVRHRYFRATKKEARKLEDQLRVEKWRQQREGLPLAELRDATVAEYGERWLRESASRLKARTLRSYTGLFRSHIVPVFGNMKIAQLHRSHVKRLLVEKHERGLSKDTIRLIRATISAMYAAAIDDNVAIVNPATLPRRAKALGRSPKANIRPLSESELAAFLSTAERQDAAYYPLFLLLARAGLRPGEARALKWSNVDFGNRKLTVAHSLSEKAEIEETKTNATRYVDMSQELSEALARRLSDREETSAKARDGQQPEWLFHNRRGNPLDDSRVRKHFQRLMRLCGISEHRVYDLRHTFATLLLSKGAPITYVASQLGHANPTTTLRWYAHWLPSDAARYVDFLDTVSERDRHQIGTRDDFEELDEEKPFVFYWSHPSDSNRRPADYESAALPTELGWPGRAACQG